MPAATLGSLQDAGHSAGLTGEDFTFVEDIPAHGAMS